MRILWILASLGLISNLSFADPAVPPSEAAATADSECIGQARLDELRYIDVRDQLRYQTELKDTAKLIMNVMEAHPGRFTGSLGPSNRGILDDGTTQVRFYKDGAQGPSGSVVTRSGKKVFQVSDDPAHTRTNAILGVEFESITEKQCDSEFTIQLILFVHDASRSQADESQGYYFRRLSVNVNWNGSVAEASERLEVLEHLQDISLADTNFKVLGDLLDRKVILEDVQNKIYKVFPVGVGAFDIRSDASMETDVSLMTYEHAEASVRPASSTTDLNDGFGSNTRSRVYPSYYKARPFIGLIDSKKGYRGIGMHYQIDYELARGFVSHGCIRMRDQDLYQLDAILNGGPQKQLEAHFVNELKGYEQYDHPMPKINDSYSATVYSRLPTDLEVRCEHDTYDIRDFGVYHTVADDDCLSLLGIRKEDAQLVIDYIRGKSTEVPKTFIANVEHVPLRADTEDGPVEEEPSSRPEGDPVDTDPGRPDGQDSDRQELLREIAEAEAAVRMAIDWAHANCTEGHGYDLYPVECQQNRADWAAWYDLVETLRGRL